MNNAPEYNRFLPHYHPIGATFFVTYRLEDSLPKTYLDSLNKWYRSESDKIVKDIPEAERGKASYMLHREYFRKFDDALDKCLSGPTFLKDPVLAKKVIEQLTRFDGQWYRLLAYTVMSNHVHVLIDFSIQLSRSTVSVPADYKNLDYVIGRIKGASSRYINLVLGRTGKSCWNEEYHDRYIRDQRHLVAAVNYIKQNPVSAGICSHWHEHPFTWVYEDVFTPL